MYAMTNCNHNEISFPPCQDLDVEAKFVDQNITSDGGILLLRAIDNKLKLTEQLAAVLPDSRHPDYIEHTLESMLKQRIYGIALGYEDLNDHDSLRHDLAFQTSAEKTEVLASSPTLCRFENNADRATSVSLSQQLVEQFITSFNTPPTELILDFDPTDDEVHGNQEGKHYHGYDGHHCFLPLHVYCARQLLVSYLRPSNIDGAKHVWAILALLVKRLRQQWPTVKIIFRADGGLCRDKILNWCERHGIGYITGIARNVRLVQATKGLIVRAEQDFERTGLTQRLFDQVFYAAKTWKRERKIIVKAEHTEQGQNPRFIVTNLDGLPQDLYEQNYCARGEMENRIKEIKLDCHSGRTSCRNWWANQFRLLLSSFAYVLLESVRRIALVKTELADARCSIIRLKLLKAGAVIKKNTRRIQFLLSEYFPWKREFMVVAHYLSSG